MVTNPENLSEEAQEKLKQMYEQAPELAQLHELREEFRAIFSCEERSNQTIKQPEVA